MAVFCPLSSILIPVKKFFLCLLQLKRRNRGKTLSSNNTQLLLANSLIILKEEKPHFPNTRYSRKLIASQLRAALSHCERIQQHRTAAFRQQCRRQALLRAHWRTQRLLQDPNFPATPRCGGPRPRHTSRWLSSEGAPRPGAVRPPRESFSSSCL